MIDHHSKSLAWIHKVSTERRIPDKTLLEKTIRALVLLESLLMQELDFVFKGGTALMLMLESSRRLSIDIDIIMPTAPEDLLEHLQMVALRGGFLRVEEQKRAVRSGLQKAHFKFWFHPSHATNQSEDCVLLDIVFEQVRYLKLQHIPISSPLISEIGNPTLVAVPSVEDILGDKLTAFAPNTTGIPYFKDGKPMAMEIMKQLFDIGCLFDLVQDFGRTVAAFKRFAIAELDYRGLEILSPDAVLQDVVDTSYCIALRGGHEAGNFEQLLAGIRSVQSHIFSERYQLDKAITHAAKAAYLARAIAAEAATLELFNHASPPQTPMIVDVERNKLNKLKKSNHEAFYYWQQALAM